jgi:hypothetical protein
MDDPFWRESARGVLAKLAQFGFNDTVKPKPPAKFADDPLFLAVMAESLAIQDRFSAEPVYAKTGKGRLKSAGVEELQRIKAARRAKTK